MKNGNDWYTINTILEKDNINNIIVITIQLQFNILFGKT